MPYTKRLDRNKFDTTLEDFQRVINIDDNLSIGDINYLITSIIHKYLKTRGLKYYNINSVIGVLECAKLELYRMVASRYEDKKRMENGAISELDSINLNEVM